MDDNHWLIIGYGNSLRRDDGAGLLLAGNFADALRAHGIAARMLLTQQLAPELALDLASSQVVAVVFVDAEERSESGPHFRVRRVEPVSATQTLGHGLSPASLWTLAAHLYDAVPPAVLATVYGQDFGHGETTTEAVQNLIDDVQALDELVDRVVRLLDIAHMGSGA